MKDCQFSKLNNDDNLLQQIGHSLDSNGCRIFYIPKNKCWFCPRCKKEFIQIESTGLPRLVMVVILSIFFLSIFANFSDDTTKEIRDNQTSESVRPPTNDINY